MNVPLFRRNFPEFANEAVYTTAQIEFWVGLAEMQLPQQTWGTAWIQAVNLYVAHEITIAGINQKAATANGTPGVSGGIANTKTVGSATVGYDAPTTTEKDGGYWNRTTYGIQLYRLIKIFGCRAIQL